MPAPTKPGPLTTAVLSIGSNLGDRLANLRGAVAGLGGAVRRVSAVYETPPWGDPDQPAYLNAAVLVRDRVPPRAWLDRAACLERTAGRVRDPGRPFGPRSLDVDVIAVWCDDGTPVHLEPPGTPSNAPSGVTLSAADVAPLTLPHPRAHLRAFVLRPWLDLDPDAELPGQGRVVDLLTTPAVAADLPGVVERPDLTLMP